MARILIVEDEQVICVALRRLLQRHGHQVAVAASLQEAAQQLTSGIFDLVVSDLQLPDGLGTDIIVDSTRAPVLIMTSYTCPTSAADSMSKGAADYIEKPFGHADMLARIDRLLSGRHPPPVPIGMSNGPEAH